MDSSKSSGKSRKRSSDSIDTNSVDTDDIDNNNIKSDTNNINNDNDRYEIVRLMNDYVTTGHEDKFYDLYSAVSNNNTVNTIKNKVTNNKTNDSNNDKPDIATLFADEIEAIRKHPSFNNSNQLAYLKEIVMIED